MPDPLINRQLGKYLIQQEIGRGGMARVYRATDTVLQRTVALKILAPQMSNDPEFAQRFEREAITAANLRHPAIITIFDVGEAEGLRYIAMEYIGGRTLADVIQEHGKLDLPLTISILGPVAEALQYAHDQGAVHRDVKPQNIMIDTDGRVLLADFGIAVGPSQQSQKLTQAGSFMGTPDYISPEQAQAQPLNGCSDMYSLGIVAYELLAGQVPFSGSVPQLIMAHVYHPAPPITSLDPQLPRELDMVFAKVLAKSPAERLEKVINFIEALRQIAQRYGLNAAPPPAVAALAVPQGSSAGQATRRMNTPMTANPAAVAALTNEIAQVFGPATDQPRPPTARREAVPPPTQRVTPPLVYPQGPDEDFVPPPPPARRERIYGGSGSPPWTIIGAGLLGLALLAFFLFRPTSGPRSSLFTPTQPLGAVIGGPVTETPVPTQSNPFGEPTVIVIPPPATNTPPPNQPTAPPAATIALPPTEPPAPSPTIAPEQPTATPEPLPTATLEPTITPEPIPTATPELIPTATLEPTVPPTPVPATATIAAAPPTPATAPTPVPGTIGGGSRLLTQSGTEIRLTDLSQNKTVTIQRDANPLGPAAFSPDGNTVLFDSLQGGTRQIMRYDASDQKVKPFIKTKGESYHPAFSPDGSRVIFVATDNGNPDLYVINSDGRGQPQALTSDASTESYPSFSPDGLQIVFESDREGQFGIYLLNGGGVSRFSTQTGFFDRYPRFSPDGKQIVFASNRDRGDETTELYVQPLVGGTTARRVTNFTGGTASGPVWSPDGQLLAFFGNATGNNDVYVIRVDGSQLTALQTSPDDERWPVWTK